MMNLFEDTLERTAPWVNRLLGTEAPFPALNLWEDRDNLVLEAELPGLRLEDVEVSATGHELVLSGERKAEGEGGPAYLRRERGSGPFHRVVPLPVSIQPGEVRASLENGVLTVTCPKSPAARARKIDIQARR